MDIKDQFKRNIVFIYGIGCYIFTAIAFICFACFVSNTFIPQALDAPRMVPLPRAIATDLSLLGIFALQHSGMARQGFKARWTKIMPQPIERSTYILFSSCCLLLFVFCWQPLGGMVWQIQNPILIISLNILAIAGGIMAATATFLTNHFDLFGLRQVYLYWQNKNYTTLEFKTPALYHLIRHPIYTGTLTLLWSTATMTISHLVLAMGLTVYILGAIPLEEKDLVEFYGQDYQEYQKRVPMLFPKLFHK